MKKLLSNSGYFLKETYIILKMNMVSTALSIFSTGLILFIFAMVVSGWWAGSKVTEAIQGNAEINVYFNASIGNEGALQLAEKINGLEGVLESRVFDEEEAYNRMEKTLGKEAGVLAVFEDNPFSSFIEVKIDLERIDPVLKALDTMNGVEYVRDNREVLDRLHNISEILKLMGFLVLIAVGVTTVVIISHIIRQGINNNREQINTLRLLGAPGTFIAFPFVLEGLLITLLGGALAAALAAFAVKQVFARMAGPLPFIPLPPEQVIVSGMLVAIMSTSAFLGVMGSLLGLSSGEQ